MRPGLFTMPAGDPRVSRAVAALAHGEGQFLLPMFAAVAQGLGLVVVQDRETSPSALHRALDAVREPAALILDGDDYQPGAPADWRCGRAALDSGHGRRWFTARRANASTMRRRCWRRR